MPVIQAEFPINIENKREMFFFYILEGNVNFNW